MACPIPVQHTLFPIPQLAAVVESDSAEHAEPVLSDYERFVVFFSSGKDSVACFLWLLDQGVPLDKIELHHHLVDGNEGSELMDWPVTADYCKKFAEAFGVRLSFSWKEGGFEREMLRKDAPTAPVHFYTRGAEDAGGRCRTKRDAREIPAGLRGPFGALVQQLSEDWRGRVVHRQRPRIPRRQNPCTYRRASRGIVSARQVQDL